MGAAAPLGTGPARAVRLGDAGRVGHSETAAGPGATPGLLRPSRWPEPDEVRGSAVLSHLPHPHRHPRGGGHGAATAGSHPNGPAGQLRVPAVRGALPIATGARGATAPRPPQRWGCSPGSGEAESAEPR